MCRNLMDLDHVAQECGWYGWSRGPQTLLEYRCGCTDGHLAEVSDHADDPTYYEDMCEYIRQCRT